MLPTATVVGAPRPRHLAILEQTSRHSPPRPASLPRLSQRLVVLPGRPVPVDDRLVAVCPLPGPLPEQVATGQEVALLEPVKVVFVTPYHAGSDRVATVIMAENEHVAVGNAQAGISVKRRGQATQEERVEPVITVQAAVSRRGRFDAPVARIGDALVALADQSQIGVRREQICNHGPAVVGRSVINHDDLVSRRRLLIERRLDGSRM